MSYQIVRGDKETRNEVQQVRERAQKWVSGGKEGRK